MDFFCRVAKVLHWDPEYITGLYFLTFRIGGRYHSYLYSVFVKQQMLSSMFRDIVSQRFKSCGRLLRSQASDFVADSLVIVEGVQQLTTLDMQKHTTLKMSRVTS